MPRGIHMHSRDNVCVLLENANIGETILVPDIAPVTALENILAPHKVAIEDIDVGAEVYKYGECIGYATALIQKGQHVHIHNVVSEKL